MFELSDIIERTDFWTDFYLGDSTTNLYRLDIIVVNFRRRLCRYPEYCVPFYVHNDMIMDDGWNLT